MYLRRIGDLREDGDIKQTEIAKYPVVSHGTYSDYESGRVNIPLEALIKLADFYHVSVDYLLERTDER